MPPPDETTARAEDPDDYYNPTFEKLSETPSGPLTGAIAYALYKNAKREWVRAFRATHGRRPTDDEYRSHSATRTDAILAAYVAQADQILGTYAQTVIREERPKILQEVLEGSFSRSFWPSFWASVAFTAVLLTVALIAALLGFGLPIQIAVPAHPSRVVSSASPPLAFPEKIRDKPRFGSASAGG